jgi:UDP-N-acetyl-D-mannosaminuronate dehydrogenase
MAHRFYLMSTSNLPLLRLATTQTWDRPRLAAQTLLRDLQHSVFNPRILIIGVGFKPGERVVSCSPAVAFADEMKKLGVKGLAFYDPLVEQEAVSWMRKLNEEDFEPGKVDGDFDAVVVCTKQVGVDWDVFKALSRSRVVWY